MCYFYNKYQRDSKTREERTSVGITSSVSGSSFAEQLRIIKADNMGAIDKEHVKGIINYFLEGTDKKYEKKKGSHTATVRVLTGYLLNANKNSRMTAKRL